MGHQAQGVVAGQMAVLVVVGLEVIDIDHQQAQRRVIERAARAFTGEGVLQPAAVVQAGEGVDVGILLGVENDLVALANPLAKHAEEVLHQLWRVLEQAGQRPAVQAQYATGAVGDGVGGGRCVVDEADFTHTLARADTRQWLVVQRAEEDAQLALQYQEQMVVATEGREQHFAIVQGIGAHVTQQQLEVAGRHVAEQAHLPEPGQVGLPVDVLHGHVRSAELKLGTINTPCWLFARQAMSIVQHYDLAMSLPGSPTNGLIPVCRANSGRHKTLLQPLGDSADFLFDHFVTHRVVAPFNGHAGLLEGIVGGSTECRQYDLVLTTVQA